MASPPAMDPATLAAAVANPLAAVASLHAAAGSPAADGDWGVAALFAAVAADPALAAQVGGRAVGGRRPPPARDRCA